MGVEHERVAEAFYDEMDREDLDSDMPEDQVRTWAIGKIAALLRQHCNPPANHLRDERGVDTPKLGKFYTTKDGYLIGNGATVYGRGSASGSVGSWIMAMDDTGASGLEDPPTVGWGGPSHDMYDVTECYSTEDAAKAAVTPPPTCPKCEPCGCEVEPDGKDIKLDPHCRTCPSCGRANRRVR